MVFAPVVAWSAVIFYASSIPGEELPKLDFWSIDKLAHAGVFMVLSVAAVLAAFHVARVRGKPVASLLKVSIFLCLLYAATDELHQAVVPNRSSEVADWLADAVGVLALHGAVAWYRQRRKISPDAPARQTERASH
jgi:VanZ family protein